MATTSKNLLGVTELTVVADIKPGLVPIAEPTTYATRLRLLLELLFVLRKKAIEVQNHFAEGGPLEGLRSLHRHCLSRTALSLEYARQSWSGPCHLFASTSSANRKVGMGGRESLPLGVRRV